MWCSKHGCPRAACGCRDGFHLSLTEEQEKELDEMAKRFKDTKGGK